MTRRTSLLIWAVLTTNLSAEQTPPLEWIRLSDDGKDFVGAESGRRFLAWGVNYDHDRRSRLLEDYWRDEWPTVVQDFREMHALGANVVRIHLQLARFMDAPEEPNAPALAQLAKVVRLAEETGLYLDVTGLGCYHEHPSWYATLDESARLDVQAIFWEAIARTCRTSAAIFCYDLMNEPVLPATGKPESEWLTGELGGKRFVQRIALDLEGRRREDVAKAWVSRLVGAIREHDDRHLITVGVIPWALPFPKAKPLFYAPAVAQELDFASVHFYPEAGRVPEALEALAIYDIGKPLVVEEMFPLKCGIEDLDRFTAGSRRRADGWLSFYWGTTIEEYEALEAPSIAEAMTRDWLTRFRAKSRSMTTPGEPSHPGAALLNLISWNILHGADPEGKLNLESKGTYLAEASVDLAFLQEVDLRCERSGKIDQMRELGRATGMEPAFGSFMPFQGGKYGMGALSKLPVKRVRTVTLPPGDEPRVALILELEVLGETLLAVNVHFNWTRDDKARYAQACALVAELAKTDQPVIVAGDFNDRPASRSLKKFYEAGFRHVDEPGSSFSAKRPRVDIDHILIRDGKRVRLERVAGGVSSAGELSDHRPVVGKIRAIRTES